MGEYTIKPHEILKHLGFDIPEEGIQVNPNDQILHAESLSSLGKTMSVDAIPETELRSMRERLTALYEGKTGTAAPFTTDESILKLRGLIKANLSATYRKV